MQSNTPTGGANAPPNDPGSARGDPPQRGFFARIPEAMRQGLFTLVMPAIAGQRLGPLPTQYSPLCLPLLTAAYLAITNQAQPALHGDADQHLGALSAFILTLGLTPAVVAHLPTAIARAATSSMGPKGPAHVATALAGSVGAMFCSETARAMRPVAQSSDIRPTTASEVAHLTAIQTAILVPGLALRARVAKAGQFALPRVAYYLKWSPPGATALACAGAACGLVPVVIALGIGKWGAFLHAVHRRENSANHEAPGNTFGVHKA
jgi:hypothetical protein